MAGQDSVSMPEIKPGMLVWGGRFRNRAGIITRVWYEDGKLKYELTPIPQGRKHTKIRNLLPFKIMSPEDSAKYLKLYEAEKLERAKKASVVVERFQSQFPENLPSGYPDTDYFRESTARVLKASKDKADKAVSFQKLMERQMKERDHG